MFWSIHNVFVWTWTCPISIALISTLINCRLKIARDGFGRLEAVTCRRYKKNSKYFFGLRSADECQIDWFFGVWTVRKPPLGNYSYFAATSFLISQTNNSALIVIDKPCDGTYASLFCISSALLVCLSKLPVKFDGHFSIEFNVNNSVFCTSYFNVLFAMKAKNTFF